MPAATRPNPTHPAKFSDPILDALRRLVHAEARRLYAEADQHVVDVLDPFAGVGRIHQLARFGTARSLPIRTTGVEIEPEWAACSSRTDCADIFDWTAERASSPDPWPFDIVASSPTYGNRFADHHVARDGSRRHSYTHDLGRQLTPGNSGELPWGRAYRALHGRVPAALGRVLADGALVLWNVSNFYKAGELVPVVEFHRGVFLGAGYEEAGNPLRVPTHRHTGNGAAPTQRRAEHEVILRFRWRERAW
jgi:hypothetical protein